VGSGKLFLWDNLTPTQKGYLAGDKTLLEFLRGDGSNEVANGGNFRDRSRYTLGTTVGGVLGDVVGGSPLKGPDAGGGYDRLPTTLNSGQASYATFRSTSGPLEDMRDTIFLGANDGMLHAFNFSTGSERFAFVPSTVYNVPRSTSGGLAEQKLRMLADPGYTHRFTVDGPPNVADAYFADAWHSVLVGSTGAGARGVFVVDVTQPEPGTSGFGANKLLWELTEADTAGVNMGFVLAYPHVVRMRNDKWAVIFGNGYDSKNGKAVLYIRDAETGAKIQEFEVDATGGNGLSQPNFVLNASREVVAIYAGDLKGNLWKFDVSDTVATNWGSPFGPTTPLFKATGPSGNVQPISVMPEISAHPNGGAVITFGTGKLFETSDTASGASNVNLSTQSIYGVWDKPLETTAVGMTAANRNTRLLQQTMLPVVAGDLPNGRRSSLTSPDWGSQRGWFLDLASGGERSNLPPQQFRNIVFVATNTPSISDPCASGGASKIFALDPVTGAAPTYAVFDLNRNSNFDDFEKGLNVLLNGSALLTQPVFQVFASPGTTASTGPTVQPVAAFDRGQATAARSGGVELTRTNGGKSTATGSGTSDDVCKALMSVAQSNTTLLQMRVNGCPLGKPRVSWRQLK
jgi:type IV pilus assembly protein PilY1